MDSLKCTINSAGDSAKRCCAACGEEKPGTTEYFPKIPQGKGGLSNKCKVCLRAYEQAWRKANPARKRQQIQRYLARKFSLPMLFTEADWTLCLQYWGGSCAVCGRQDGLFNLRIVPDHWISTSSQQYPGGIATNILPLCHGNGGCNNSKKNKEPIAWLAKRLKELKIPQPTKVLPRINTYFAMVKIRQQQCLPQNMETLEEPVLPALNAIPDMLKSTVVKLATLIETWHATAAPYDTQIRNLEMVKGLALAALMPEIAALQDILRPYAVAKKDDAA